MKGIFIRPKAGTIPRVLLSSLLFITLCGCSMFFSGTDSKDIDYYSRTVEYSRYFEDSFNSLLPIESRAYDQHGNYTGLVEYSYEYRDENDEYVLSRADVYSISNNQKTLDSYFEYTYDYNDYTFEGFTEKENLLLKGENYSGNGTLLTWYELEFNRFGGLHPAMYSKIIDYQGEGRSNIIAITESYYDKVVGDYYDYYVEKFFTIPTGTNKLSLSEEFACFYNAEGQWTHELYHTRGTYTDPGTGDLKFFYTKYDWNEDGQVYLQQDFAYTPGNEVPLLNNGDYSNGTYDPGDPSDPGDPGRFKTGFIEFKNIGRRVEALDRTYDDRGNVILDVRSSYGKEMERIVNRYNTNDELLSKVRYVNGASSPYDRTEIRFSEQYRGDVLYQVKEELIYRTVDTETGENRKMARSAVVGSDVLDPAFKSYCTSIYRPLRSNHER